MYPPAIGTFREIPETKAIDGITLEKVITHSRIVLPPSIS